MDDRTAIDVALRFMILVGFVAALVLCHQLYGIYRAKKLAESAPAAELRDGGAG